MIIIEVFASQIICLNFLLLCYIKGLKNGVLRKMSCLRTDDGIFILTLLDKYAKRGERIFSCFVDFAKFYDSISHNLLFTKLAEKGISGNFYFLLKNMYNNCSYAIKALLPCDPLCGEKNIEKKTNSYQWFRTSSFRAKIGLKKGRNLSPLLANILLSNLHEGHYYAPQLHQKMLPQSVGQMTC